MDSDAEVAFDYPGIIRVYKSGRVERSLDPTFGFVAPAADPSTGVNSKDVPIPCGVSARLYLPPNVITGENNKLPILLYIHGGGFFMGSAFSPFYHPFLNSLVAKSDVIAVSVEYRLAPEQPVPAAYDDCFAALKWVLSHNADDWIKTYGDLKKITVAGDSAGGNIAHNVVMRAGKEGIRVDGMVVLFPYFWGSERLGKEEERRSMLRLEWLDTQWPYFCPSAKDNGGNDDARINPMADGAPGLEKLGCRRAMVMVAEHDALYARGKAYAAALRRSEWGGMVELVDYEDEDHCFHFQKQDSCKAKDLVQRVAKFLNVRC